MTQYPIGSKTRRHGRYYRVVVLRTWKDQRPPYARRGEQVVTTFDDCRAKVQVGREQVLFADASGEVTRCDPPIAADDPSAPVRQLETEGQPHEVPGGR